VNITIVDDDEAVRDSLKLLLELEGFHVDTFVSGDAYLKADHSAADSVLLLDLHMPGRSGQDVIERLLKSPPHPPIIVITAFDDPLTKRQVLEAGATAILPKPVDHAMLLAQIDACHPALASRPQ
jgi:two-component system response regulator FixJ